MTKYTFVIDTNTYAGNFERKMCAYITGRIGECGVGADWAEKFFTDMNLDDNYNYDDPFDNIEDVADEHGCHRPVYIQTTPGWINSGYGGHFRDTPEGRKQALAHLKQEGIAYYTKQRKQAFDRLLLATQQDPTILKLGWSVGACTNDIARCDEHITKYQALAEAIHYAAYNSVGIFFHSKPTIQQIELMKQRAQQFTKLYEKSRWGTSITIEGFRLLRTTTEEEVTIL